MSNKALVLTSGMLTIISLLAMYLGNDQLPGVCVGIIGGVMTGKAIK